MEFAQMTYRIPTTAQAERIHQVFEVALAERPGQAELLREVERVIVQQPDDSGSGFPEPVEVLVQQMVAILPGRGTVAEQKLLKQLRKGRE
ncbi:hypothetical protein GCM10009616_37810 [Microlunatus lacustris]